MTTTTRKIRQLRSRHYVPVSIIPRFIAIAILCFLRPAFLFPSEEQTASPLWCADAYRVGDTIETSISTRSSLNIDMLIANQPLFGVTKTAFLPRLPERFSLSFEDGLHTLPYVDASTTDTLVVTFVYSTSGNGRIHSVTSEAIPSSRKSKFDPSKDVEVIFEWVEEASVDFVAGSIVMFLAVFVVSILFLFQLCSIDNDNDDYEDRREDHNNSYYKGR